MGNTRSIAAGPWDAKFRNAVHMFDTCMINCFLCKLIDVIPLSN